MEAQCYNTHHIVCVGARSEGTDGQTSCRGAGTGLSGRPRSAQAVPVSTTSRQRASCGFECESRTATHLRGCRRLGFSDLAAAIPPIPRLESGWAYGSLAPSKMQRKWCCDPPRLNRKRWVCVLCRIANARSSHSLHALIPVSLTLRGSCVRACRSWVSQG